jgi:hypothetical protein
MGLEEVKNAIMKMMESGVTFIEERLATMSDEEKNKLITESQVKDLQSAFADKGTATFLTNEDHLNIALLLARRGVAAMKKQMEEENNGK